MAEKIKIGDTIRNTPSGGGAYTGEHCPECGGRILHNGSYLCENWTWEVVREGATKKPDYVTTCDYGVPSDVQTRYIDRVLSYRLSGYWNTEGERNGELRYYTHRRPPGKTGYVKKKHQEYLDKLGPVPKPWFELRNERKKEAQK